MKTLTPIERALKDMQAQFAGKAKRWEEEKRKRLAARSQALDAEWRDMEAEEAEAARLHREEFRDDFEPVNSFMRSGRGWSRRVDGYNREQEI